MERVLFWNTLDFDLYKDKTIILRAWEPITTRRKTSKGSDAAFVGVNDATLQAPSLLILHKIFLTMGNKISQLYFFGFEGKYFPI